MRGVGGGVARAADVADQVAAVYDLALVQSAGIPIEMRVVVGVGLRRVELVDRVAAASPAVEQLRDRAVFDGANRSRSRRHDVERLVLAKAKAARLGERIAQ